LGRLLQGHLIAVKPSHASNCELVPFPINAQMRKPLVAAQTFGPPPPAAPKTNGDPKAALVEIIDEVGALDTTH
jgi:hypothetical protein